MKYISIDTETTGLNPEYCQILEIGAVFGDTEDPAVKTKPENQFQCLVKHPIYRGDAIGLSMNSKLLLEIENPLEGMTVLDIDTAITVFQACVEAWTLTNDKCKISPCGKNYASFDKPFLIKAGMKFDLLRNRSFDLGNLFLRWYDKDIPNTEECCKRAGRPYLNYHRALEDAIQCGILLETWFANQEKILSEAISESRS